METKKKLPELYIMSCRKCPYMQLTASSYMGSLSRPITQLNAVCRLGRFDKRVESANLFHFEAPSHTALEILREGDYGEEIPDWCPLDDWYSPTC